MQKRSVFFQLIGVFTSDRRPVSWKCTDAPQDGEGRARVSPFDSCGDSLTSRVGERQQPALNLLLEIAPSGIVRRLELPVLAQPPMQR